MPTRRRRTAIERMDTARHEAGHAVAAVVLGLALEKVSAAPHRGAWGGCWLSSDAADRTTARREAVQAVAGYVAERLASGDASRSASRDDYLDVRRLAEHHGIGPRREPAGTYDARYRRWLRRLEREAASILRSNWQWVEAVSSALLTRRVLTAADVLRLRPWG